MFTSLHLARVAQSHILLNAAARPFFARPEERLLVQTVPALQRRMDLELRMLVASFEQLAQKLAASLEVVLRPLTKSPCLGVSLCSPLFWSFVIVHACLCAFSPLFRVPMCFSCLQGARAVQYE